MKLLLATNDYPPKIGGIQVYLEEIVRRLPPEDVTVVALDHPGATDFDAAQSYRIDRLGGPMLLPVPAVATRVARVAEEVGADVVLLDPVWPLGAIGLRLDRPFGVIVHGAELTVPGRLPFTQLAARATLRAAEVVVAAGGYPAAEAARVAGRPVPTIQMPPGVDTDRFVPLAGPERAAVRDRHGIDPDAVVVLCVSRLVPRKGIDVLLQAVRRVADRAPVQLVVGGEGRDRNRLEQIAKALEVPARFLGRVAAEDLPGLYGAADVFAMCCRNRWGGLEQEGFGIVFLEAAAAGLPAIAGDSGGAAEAVQDGETGFVVPPRDLEAITEALGAVVDDPARRLAMGARGRERAVRSFSYDRNVPTLVDDLARVVAARDPERA